MPASDLLSFPEPAAAPKPGAAGLLEIGGPAPSAARPGKRIIKPVAAIKAGRMQLVDPDEIEYEVPTNAGMWAETTNMVPMVSTMKGARTFISSKYLSQSLPLKDPEAALVDSLDEETGEPISKRIGTELGIKKASVNGIIHSVAPGAITIYGEDGKMHTEEIDHYTPHARKTASHDTALLKPGDKVLAGQPIAHSNYVSPDGHLAMGKNLRVAFVPGPDGSTFEDAIAVSESAAKKLTSQHLYGYDIEHKNGIASEKQKWVSLFPNKYTTEQLDKIGSDGKPKPGVTINPGDPILLAYKPRSLSAKDSALGNLHKVMRNSYEDITQTWEKPAPGIVSDSAKTRKGMSVNLISEMPLRVGDKVSSRSGSKGVISRIFSDDQMYRDANDEPVDILINPASMIGRVNPMQTFEAQLGKIAKKTGKPYYVPSFMKGSFRDFVASELDKNGLSATEDLFDPRTGRKVPQAQTGYQYFQKLEHISNDKESGRGDGGTDLNGQPTKGGDEGAKRMGGLLNNAILSHGAPEVILDAQVLRGVNHPEMWKRVRAGQPLPAPQVPFIFNKFLSTLKGAGIRVDRQGDNFNISALTDKDLDGTYAIDNDETIDNRDGEPIKGGLFDHSKFGGPNGTETAHIKLETPMPNPFLEEPIRRMLGLTQKRYREVIAGRESINGKTGADAVAEAMRGIDLKRVETDARDLIRSGKKSKRDDAVKLLNFATGFQRSGIKPEDMVITKVPVIPPTYRPISLMDKMALVSDANYLYKDLFAAQKALALNRNDLPDSELGDEKIAVYDAIKAIQGLGDPISVENQERGVKGFIRQISGSGGPKTGLFSAKVVGHPVNAVGRSVIIPNADLNMDEVGIPEKMAWRSFNAYTMGRMVRDGMPAMDAARHLESRSDTARKYLLQEMEHRRVMYSRDPALHRNSIMGAKARLVPGSSIQLSPLVVGPFGADFDGDSGRFLLRLKISIPESDKSVYNSGMVSSEQLAYIQDIPTIDGSERKLSETVTELDVKPGVSIQAIMPDGSYDWFPVTSMSIHEGLSMKHVLLDKGKESLFVSDDHSLVTWDAGRVRKIKPADAIGKMVPALTNTSSLGADCKDSITFSESRSVPVAAGSSTRRSSARSYSWEHIMPLNRNTGVFLGMLIGDGWIDVSDKFCFAYSDDCIREAIEAMGDSPDLPFRGQYRDLTSETKGSLVKGGTAAVDKSKAFLACSQFGRVLSPHIGKGAKNKKVPGFSFSAPESHRLGILDGLLSTDGTVCICKAKRKKKPQLQVQITTTSPDLVEGVKQLCLTLGIRSSASSYPCPTGDGIAWNCSLSSVDFKKMVTRTGFTITNRRKQALMEEGLPLVDENRNNLSGDIVPYCTELHTSILDLRNEIVAAGYPSKPSSLTVSLSTAKAKGAISRYLATFIADAILKPETVPNGLAAWAYMVKNKEIRWMRVTAIEDAGTMTGYDLTIPGPYTFATAGGIFVQDSMNVHVPVSEEANQAIKDRMLPSKNLLSIKAHAAHYVPSQEFILGIFSSSIPNKAKPQSIFNSRKEALDAYNKGLIDIDSPVSIAGE